VGVGLSAHRQHLPELAPGHRRIARLAVGERGAPDHRDQLRRALRVPALIRFDDQVAIVTGAGHGLGRAYALELAARGASVVCNDIVDERADAVAAEIEDAGGTAIADVYSVADAPSGAAIVSGALDRFGRVDVVVNNAGQLRNGPFPELPSDDVEAVVATHLAGAFHVTQPAFRAMQAAGYGRIVFTSSAALFGGSWQANYAAAKAGMFGLCHVVASEGARHGIRANTILPMALTGLGHDGPPPFPPDELAETIAAISPLAPQLTVENVAPLVVYLASRECAVTGRAFSVGAGHVAEVFVGLARGWCADDEPLSAESIASQLAAICDRTHYTVPESMNAATRAIGAVVRPTVSPEEEP
jgi:NAD(P)-dependent dehydrogenase (short-subunit alcohol dehydrogenase family)